MDLKLISTVICDDVLRNPGGWLSLYTLFREVYADAYPTTLVRMHVVTTWLNESAQARQVIQRVAVIIIPIVVAAYGAIQAFGLRISALFARLGSLVPGLPSGPFEVFGEATARQEGW